MWLLPLLKEPQLIILLSAYLNKFDFAFLTKVNFAPFTKVNFAYI